MKRKRYTEEQIILIWGTSKKVLKKDRYQKEQYQEKVYDEKGHQVEGITELLNL